MKCSTDVAVSEFLERTLCNLGFIALCDCPNTEFSAFYNLRSIQKPEKRNNPEADASARMSTLLQYMLCVSRFAHFIKVMARDKIGSLDTSGLERELNNWLADYICGADSSPEEKTKRPLEAGRVRLVPIPGQAGAYSCNIELKPHFELEEMVAAVRFQTKLVGA
jgi:type VI secretion system protein ImpC